MSSLTMIEQEVQLRLQISELEIEATAKKQAADKAIQEATQALNEVHKNNKNSSSSNQQQEQEQEQQEPENKDKPSIHGAIDAIAKMIQTAEKEADTDAIAIGAEGGDGDGDGDDEAREETTAAEEGRPGIDGPPLIVRQTDFLPSDTEPESSSNVVATPSNTTTTTSVHPNPNQDSDNPMEDTLDTLMTKIEGCTLVLTNPDATMEEQVDAAHLARQYAKAAKALHSAKYD